ncbi:MAG: hypothetical protein ABSG83_16500 [Roseiarcus sp.]
MDREIQLPASDAAFATLDASFDAHCEAAWACEVAQLSALETAFPTLAASSDAHCEAA